MDLTEVDIGVFLTDNIIVKDYLQYIEADENFHILHHKGVIEPIRS